MRVAINGVSGWLGQASLGALKEIENTVNIDNLQLIASTARSIQSLELGEFTSKSLDLDIPSLEKSDVFIQLAFKTRDYISKLGEVAYEKANKQIIELSLNAIKKTQPTHVVMVSSGVVTQWLENPDKHRFDPYIKMKLVEEAEIGKLCKELGANLVNLRLWGASGLHMTEPLKYAIGDLIYQDSNLEFINIKSSQQVFRRFADASQQMQVCIQAATHGENLVLDSGGTVVEIEELAQEIIKFSGSNKPIRRQNPLASNPDSYFAESQEMEQLANRFEINLHGIQSQISLTSRAVSRYLNQESGPSK